MHLLLTGTSFPWVTIDDASCFRYPQSPRPSSSLSFLNREDAVTSLLVVVVDDVMLVVSHFSAAEGAVVLLGEDVGRDKGGLLLICSIEVLAAEDGEVQLREVAGDSFFEP